MLPKGQCPAASLWTLRSYYSSQSSSLQAHKKTAQVLRNFPQKTILKNDNHSSIKGNPAVPPPPATVNTSTNNLAIPETIKKTLEPNTLNIKRILSSEPVPTLSYGLERVLFQPGVNWLRDVRTKVCNFDPFLRTIPTPEQFNFEAVPDFVPASRDTSLHQLASQQSCSFVSSTSSISQSMSIIYFVLSRMKPLNLDCLSQAFSEEPRSYTVLSRSPTAVLLKPHGAKLRSIVVEKIDEPENVLQQLGQILERLLTEPKENFLRMLKGSEVPPLVRPIEAYAYTVAGKILLRSQLDCQDARLPRKTFDLKTRAALPIRMDLQNYQKYSDYRLLTSTGLYSSFEREYFDMCRSAFLKYNFQVRIGDMDGIFVAYHNAFEMFGFQYVSREELDERIYGNSTTGDAAFSLILQVYNEILEAIVPLYPNNHTIRLTFATDKGGLRLVVFAEDAGIDGTNSRKDVKQFIITLNSSINGFRTENVNLDARGSDQWKVNASIAQVGTNTSEYDSIRSKATQGRVEPDESRSSFSFLRLIKEAQDNSPPINYSGGPDVFAPWTLM